MIVKNRNSLIVELVGVAGSGKSSVCNVLNERNDIMLINEAPDFKNIWNTPFFVRNTLVLLPVLLRVFLRKNFGMFPLQAIIWMVILQGWHRILRKKASVNRGTILLDEGPVWLMACLKMWGPEGLKSEGLRKWWKRIYRIWASTLDTLIWLDCSESLLINRIRGRPNWHSIKVKSDSKSFEYLNEIRNTYIQLISALTEEARDLKVVKVDTEQESPDAIAKELFAKATLNDGLG